MKTLINSDGNGTTKNVPDVEFFGNPDSFALLCKASSQKEGWMKSTKAMEIPGVGCLVQVTTQQLSPDGNSYALAEALTFVPGVQVDCVYEYRGEKQLIGRRLVSMAPQDAPIDKNVKNLPDITELPATEAEMLQMMTDDDGGKEPESDDE